MKSAQYLAETDALRRLAAAKAEAEAAERRAAEPRIYRIIRFRNGGSRTVRSNVTLTEAQAHCSLEKTHGPGWFDGYEYMRGCAPERS